MGTMSVLIIGVVGVLLLTAIIVSNDMKHYNATHKGRNRNVR